MYFLIGMFFVYSLWCMQDEQDLRKKPLSIECQDGRTVEFKDEVAQFFREHTSIKVDDFEGPCILPVSYASVKVLEQWIKDSCPGWGYLELTPIIQSLEQMDLKTMAARIKDLDYLGCDIFLAAAYESCAQKLLHPHFIQQFKSGDPRCKNILSQLAGVSSELASKIIFGDIKCLNDLCRTYVKQLLKVDGSSRSLFIHDYPSALALSKQGTTFIVGTSAGCAKVYAGDEDKNFTPLKDANFPGISALAISDDAETIAVRCDGGWEGFRTGSFAGWTAVWNIQDDSGKEIQHNFEIRTLSIVGAKILSILDQPGQLCIYDTNSNTSMTVVDGKSQYEHITQAYMNQEGTVIFTGSRFRDFKNGCLSMWKLLEKAPQQWTRAKYQGYAQYVGYKDIFPTAIAVNEVTKTIISGWSDGDIVFITYDDHKLIAGSKVSLLKDMPIDSLHMNFTTQMGIVASYKQNIIALVDFKNQFPKIFCNILDSQDFQHISKGIREVKADERVEKIAFCDNRYAYLVDLKRVYSLLGEVKNDLCVEQALMLVAKSRDAAFDLSKEPFIELVNNLPKHIKSLYQPREPASLCIVS